MQISECSSFPTFKELALCLQNSIREYTEFSFQPSIAMLPIR